MGTHHGPVRGSTYIYNIYTHVIYLPTYLVPISMRYTRWKHNIYTNKAIIVA